MSSEIALPGVIVPGRVDSGLDASLAPSRSPLSKHALNVADIHRLVLERGSLSAVIIRVEDGRPAGVCRLVQFRSYNEQELDEAVKESARLYGKIAPNHYMLVHVGSLKVYGDHQTGVLLDMLIPIATYGIIPFDNGRWSKTTFVALPDDLSKIFGLSESQAAAYLERIFRVVNNPLRHGETDGMSPDELTREIIRRSQS